MNIPPIGEVSRHPNIDEWLMSEPYALPCLKGHSVRFVFDGYTDEYQMDYQAAIQNLINLDASALAAVAPHVAQYCREMISIYDPADRPDIRIVHASDIWGYIQFGEEMHVVRRAAGDDEEGIYFSLESACDWEQEHGLDLVLRDGLAFTKVGPFDGHITNSDAMETVP